MKKKKITQVFERACFFKIRILIYLLSMYNKTLPATIKKLVWE